MQLNGKALTRPTVMTLRMSKNLPYYFIGASFFADAILALGMAIAPSTVDTEWPHRVGVVLTGVLLSVAILLGLVSAIQGEHRRHGAVAMAIAVFLQIGWTGFYVWAATAEQELSVELAASFKSGFTVDKLAERALNSPVLRGRELAASYAFREFGARIEYADASGNVRAFEPTSLDLEKHARNQQLQAGMADAQSLLRHQARSFRWAALARLLSLAGVLLAGAIVLAGPKRRHGWLTCRSS